VAITSFFSLRDLNFHRTFVTTANGLHQLSNLLWVELAINGAMLALNSQLDDAAQAVVHHDCALVDGPLDVAWRQVIDAPAPFHVVGDASMDDPVDSQT
jgi:hypothetical protein